MKKEKVKDTPQENKMPVAASKQPENKPATPAADPKVDKLKEDEKKKAKVRIQQKYNRKSTCFVPPSLRQWKSWQMGWKSCTW